MFLHLGFLVTRESEKNEKSTRHIYFLRSSLRLPKPKCATKKSIGYFPLNPGCLMMGSLCHGLWNNPRITGQDFIPPKKNSTTRGRCLIQMCTSPWCVWLRNANPWGDLSSFQKDVETTELLLMATRNPAWKPVEVGTGMSRDGSGWINGLDYNLLINGVFLGVI